MDKQCISPIVKWAGGKRQLLPYINDMAPKSFKTYYEPFLGGGAVLFDLQPKKAIVSDTNVGLMNVYKQIKENPTEVIRSVKKYDRGVCDEQKYYKLRDKFNHYISTNTLNADSAALFIWINKHCFNGLYRENTEGLFNVPYNNKTQTVSVQSENIFNMSAYLKNITLLTADFENVSMKAKEGDFIFFDSPYIPIKADSFIDYTKDGFTEGNHRRLAWVYTKLAERGVKCMLTNHNVPLVYELYDGFNILPVDVKRMINRDANNRSGKEVIITNYNSDEKCL